jgi:hypothetical protein
LSNKSDTFLANPTFSIKNGGANKRSMKDDLLLSISSHVVPVIYLSFEVFGATIPT